MSTFALFHLPLVPIRSILHVMDLSDKIHLSMSSKKTYEIAKAVGGKLSVAALSGKQRDTLNVLDKINLLFLEISMDSDKFYENYIRTMEIIISDDFKFNFEVYSKNKFGFVFFTIQMGYKPGQWKCEGTKGTLKIGDSFVPVVMTDNLQMHTFWEREVEGFQMIVDYFIQNFKPQVKLKIEKGIRKDFSENLKSFVDWINSTEHTIENCTVNKAEQFSDENYKFVMDNVTTTTSIRLLGQRRQEFQHNPQIKTNHFHLNSAYWLTLDNLLMMNCPNISLYDSSMTNTDMSEYITKNLTKWVAGELSYFESLEVELAELVDEKHILQAVGTLLQPQIGGYTSVLEEDGVLIKRNDGVSAKIMIPLLPSRIFEIRV